MGVETYLGLGLLIALVVGLVLVIHGTMAKNKWGITLRRVQCPNCATEMARLRIPSSAEQALWGGYTCPSCKCETDKWGRPRGKATGLTHRTDRFSGP
jgi:hypothetical protein